MIILGITTSDEMLTGLGKRYQAAHTRSLRGAVTDYHDQLFPRHFFNSNRARYRLAPRTAFYLKVIKPKRGIGTGRFVDLILTGRSMRRMMHFFTVRASDGGNSMVLRMDAPRYFTQKFQGQPDKVDEAEQINEDDKSKIRGFYANRMQAEWNKIKQRRTKKV